MELYEHTNYDFYVAVQRKLTRRKTDSGKKYFSWCDEEMMSWVNERLHTYKSNIETILCHGCRCGTEVDVLTRLNPTAKVFGTDIYGEAFKFDRTYFREMDWDTVPEEWMNYFDVIYSNSIDHSRHPIDTLLAWKSELKSDGICYISFYWGRGVSREDCFQLDRTRPMDEINEICSKAKMKVLYISDPYFDQHRSHIADVIMRKEYD